MIHISIKLLILYARVLQSFWLCELTGGGEGSCEWPAIAHVFSCPLLAQVGIPLVQMECAGTHLPTACLLLALVGLHELAYCFYGLFLNTSWPTSGLGVVDACFYAFYEFICLDKLSENGWFQLPVFFFLVEKSLHIQL